MNTRTRTRTLEKSWAKHMIQRAQTHRATTDSLPWCNVLSSTDLFFLWACKILGFSPRETDRGLETDPSNQRENNQNSSFLFGGLFTNRSCENRWIGHCWELNMTKSSVFYLPPSKLSHTSIHQVQTHAHLKKNSECWDPASRPDGLI